MYVGPHLVSRMTSTPFVGTERAATGPRTLNGSCGVHGLGDRGCSQPKTDMQQCGQETTFAWRGSPKNWAAGKVGRFSALELYTMHSTPLFWHGPPLTGAVPVGWARRMFRARPTSTSDKRRACRSESGSPRSAGLLPAKCAEGWRRPPHRGFITRTSGHEAIADDRGCKASQPLAGPQSLKAGVDRPGLRFRYQILTVSVESP